MAVLRRLGRAIGALLIALAPAAAGEEPPSPGEYADDLADLAPRARELEQERYSVCVRATAIYECVSYGADGNLRRERKRAVAHGTAFGYRRDGGDTLLLTNQHVAEWPAVTDEAHAVDDVPTGCKRVADSLKIVDNDSDDYERDDIALQRVVADPQLDIAVLRAHQALPIIPWKIGRSAALRERNVVEVRGFPLGAFRATNVGKVISAYDHDDYKEWDHDDFVVDALLSAGNSGSPVLAVSRRTGEFELVGVFHAGYSHGSALNVVIGIDQLRDIMTTLKRSSRPRSDGVDGAALDADARARLRHDAESGAEPFFPLGPLTATARTRGDGAIVFELFSRDFPRAVHPIFAFEDLPAPGAFGVPGRSWFGGPAGIRLCDRGSLDADEQAQLARLVEALRRSAVAFLAHHAAARTASSRQQAETLARVERSLGRTVDAQREIAQAALDLSDRHAPHDADTALDVVVLAQAPPTDAPALASVPNRPGSAPH